MKPNVLIVCSKNKRRSKTAGVIFKNDPRFLVRSAGLSQKSERKITESDLNWADLVLVMEKEHKTKIGTLFKHIPLPPINVLFIADDYDFMQEELVNLLKDKISLNISQMI